MTFPIQVASQRSGVSPHVIRIWERRYSALVPNRTGTNRRMYSDEEITRLRLLRELTENGHRIGSIAELVTEDLARLLNEERNQLHHRFQVDATPALITPEQFVTTCFEAAQAFEGERLRRLLHRARLELGQRCTLLHVISPLLRQLGSAWQEGKLRTGQEHLGTAIIRDVLVTPVPGSQTAEGAPEIVMATPSGEVHELGALLAASSARDLGWNVTYLGTNLPAEEIAACACARAARAVAISVIYPEESPAIHKQIRELRRLLPDEIALVVGGRAASGYQSQLPDLKIEWATDLAEFDALLSRLSRPKTAS